MYRPQDHVPEPSFRCTWKAHTTYEPRQTNGIAPMERIRVETVPEGMQRTVVNIKTSAAAS
jgi:hypothetical protein